MGDTVKIIPLGGFDRIGMNMTVIEYNDSLIVIDCGASFMDAFKYGIDTTIPNISYLTQNIDKVKGIILTHGHEDHIGALPFVIPEINVPVYGTPLTIALASRKLNDCDIKKYKAKVIRAGNAITLGDFRIEFIRSNHSIPDSVMLAIYTPVGIIVHTGDFKIDYTPVNGEAVDLKRLGMIGYKGVLAVLPDSTNAALSGSSKSEMAVAETLISLFDKCRHGRIFVSVFASNVDRVRQIIQLAKENHRKVVLQGELMIRILEEADKLGIISIPDGILISLNDISEYEDDELLFITTGNHGEAYSYIADIAEDVNDKLNIKEGDNIIFSSIVTSGFGNLFNDIINKLSQKGANVYYQDVHATGHACEEEIKLLYNLLSPKYVIPAHGEYRLRKAAGDIAVSTGIDKDNVIYINNGDVLELNGERAVVTDRVNCSEIYVDGLLVSEDGGAIVDLRSMMAESGVAFLSVCFDSKSKLMTAPPKCTLVGVSDMMLKEMIEREAMIIIGDCRSKNIAISKMKSIIRQELKKIIRNRYTISPIIVVDLRSTV